MSVSVLREQNEQEVSFGHSAVSYPKEELWKMVSKKLGIVGAVRRAIRGMT